MTIIEDEKIRFGKPVIEGTRVGVEDVVESFYELEKSTSAISEEFGLTMTEVEEAIRYYHRNRNSREAAEV